MTSPPQKPGVLFVQLAATRNGAAIALLHVLRWLGKTGNRPFSVLLCEGGDVVMEFAGAGRTQIASESRWCPGGIRARLTRGLGLGQLAHSLERADLRRAASDYRPGLVYMNGFSSENFRLIEVLDLGVPMLTHVHELGQLFRQQAGSALPRMLSHTQRFVACSSAVRENLVKEHHIDAARVEIVYPSISVNNVRPQRTREDVLRELNLPDDALILAACGSAGWNKGTDIFLWLAQTVCKQRERARFVWVGDTTRLTVPQYENDIAKTGLKGKLHFTGPVAHPADYISAADIFVLPSREDSFPLVCLEAAALGKPIVCFAEAGGMPEFVEKDAGFVVPYLDILAMSDKVIGLLDSAECRLKMGATAQRKVAARHDISIAAPRIAEIIERTIAG